MCYVIVRRDLVRDGLSPSVMPKGKRADKHWTTISELGYNEAVHRFHYRYLPRDTKAGNNIECWIVSGERITIFQANTIDFDFVD